MSFKSFVVVAALAGSACASPVFVPSSYYAWIGKSQGLGGLTPVVSSSDINNTDLYAPDVFYTNLAHITDPADRLLINVDFLFFGNNGFNGRGGGINMLFSPSTDATLTFSTTAGPSFTSTAVGRLFENGNMLLLSLSDPPSSIQVLAGHTYELELSASVYGNLEHATASVELTSPVPTPAGATLFTAAALASAARRRK